MANSGTTPPRSAINVNLSLEEKKQLEAVARHYNMYEKDVLKALLKREAIRISK